MADKNIGLFVAKLNRAIQEGVKLFNDYKNLSKDFQKEQKYLTTKFRDQKKEMDEINKRRTGIAKRKLSKALTQDQIKLANLLNQELKEKQNEIKNLDKKSESAFVKINKIFLKEKEKIRKIKKKVLKNILDIGKEIRSLMDPKEFKKFIDRIYKRRYEVLNGKTISFKTLLHHLESAEVTENVAKKQKKIDDLMSIRNIINRKKKMEIGIKKKEIEYLLKEYKKTEKISKNSVEKEIKKLVKSLNGISDKNEKEKTTLEIDSLAKSLKNKLDKQKQIKLQLKFKEEQLQRLLKLQESS